MGVEVINLWIVMRRDGEVCDLQVGFVRLRD